jgi:hypothetical protein
MDGNKTMATQTQQINFDELKKQYPVALFNRVALDSYSDTSWRGDCPFCGQHATPSFSLSLTPESKGGVFVFTDSRII